MEKKGIKTEKGEFNRWIRATNAFIRNLRKNLSLLLEAIKEIKELDITEVIELLEYVFHKEDVQKAVQRMKNAHDLRNRNAKEG